MKCDDLKTVHEASFFFQLLTLTSTLEAKERIWIDVMVTHKKAQHYPHHHHQEQVAVEYTMCSI